MEAVTGILVLAHCGAKWWACDVGSAIMFIGFVVFCVVGLKRLERRTEARAQAYREAREAIEARVALGQQAPSEPTADLGE
jgi:uncharacterized membrane protein